MPSTRGAATSWTFKTSGARLQQVAIDAPKSDFMAVQQTMVPQDCNAWENKQASWLFEKTKRDALGGAAVGIAKKYKQNVEVVFTKRFVVAVALRFGCKRLAAASVYLPVRMRNSGEVQERLSYVTEWIQMYKPDIILCAGDFNCGFRDFVDMSGMRWGIERVACRHTDLVSAWVTGMGLRTQADSVMEDSWTRSTWSPPRTRTQIDFWLTKGGERNTFTTWPELSTVRSDHCLLLMGWQIHVPRASARPPRTRRPCRTRWRLGTRARRRRAQLSARCRRTTPA